MRVAAQISVLFIFIRARPSWSVDGADPKSRVQWPAYLRYVWII